MVTMLATGLLACFGFLPQTNAAPEVVPAPDGCYSQFTTAEGCQALQFNITAALQIQDLVGVRSSPTRAAATILALVLERLSSIPAMGIPQWAL